ncbi:MAG: hypothetical protein LBF51_06715 [Zoogloeaceae bacterium]|jgi:hypothetical protein|nr:hypothetical protein [Zoogloeaceae bacterium]
MIPIRRSAGFLCMALLGIALSGCLTTTALITGPSVTPVPEAENTASNARLRVVSNEGVVRAIPKKACLDDSAPDTGVILGGKGDLRGQSRNMPNPERIGDHPFAELYVAAGKPLVLNFQVGPESRARCALAGTFVPQAGKDYEAYATVSEGKCALTVRFRNLANGLWKPERLTGAQKCKR